MDADPPGPSAADGRLAIARALLAPPAAARDPVWPAFAGALLAAACAVTAAAAVIVGGPVLGERPGAAPLAAPASR